MDNQRLLIWGLFGLLAWITYQTWIQEFAPKPPETTAIEQPELSAPAEGSDLPPLSAPSEVALDAPMPIDDAAPVMATGTSTAPTIRVVTDVFEVEISTQGGTLQAASLTGYPVAKDQPDTLVQLLSDEAQNFGRIQTGLRILGEGDEPNHLAVFTSGRDTYSLDSADEIVVPLIWRSATGVEVEKRFHFKRGSYSIAIEQEVTNGSDGLWRGAEYAQIQRIFKEQERSMFDVDSYSFAGPIIYDGEKSEKLKHGDLLEDGAYKRENKKNGWIGSIEHHFFECRCSGGGYRADLYHLRTWRPLDGKRDCQSAIDRAGL